MTQWTKGPWGVVVTRPDGATVYLNTGDDALNSRIVTAVNAHDEMAALLESFAARGCQSKYCDRNPGMTCCECEARALLARIRGE